MPDDIGRADAYAAGMAVVALEDAFIDLVELLLHDETLRRVEVMALRHLHLARFDVAQRAGKFPRAYAEAIESRRERLETSWEKKLGHNSVSTFTPILGTAGSRCSSLLTGIPIPSA